jgi:hypothetical protein
MKTKIAYKIVRIRKDGSLGPLFCNMKQRIPLNTWIQAECHPPPNKTIRVGWHTTEKQTAPHIYMTLPKKNIKRVWVKVEIKNFKECQRPISQGGLWYIAQWMKVLKII